MDWVILVVSGAMEAVWAQALDRSEGFSQPVPTLIFSPRSQRACSDSAMPSVRFRWAPPTPPGSASGPRSRSRGSVLTGAEPFSWAKLLLITGLVACVIGLKLVGEAR